MSDTLYPKLESAVAWASRRVRLRGEEVLGEAWLGWLDGERTFRNFRNARGASRANHCRRRAVGRVTFTFGVMPRRRRRYDRKFIERCGRERVTARPDYAAESDEFRRLLSLLEGYRAHQLVIALHFGAGMSTTEIAPVVGVSVARVKQLRQEAIAILRDKFNGKSKAIQHAATTRKAA